jgi:hypothetical protein
MAESSRDPAEESVNGEAPAVPGKFRGIVHFNFSGGKRYK